LQEEGGNGSRNGRSSEEATEKSGRGARRGTIRSEEEAKAYTSNSPSYARNAFCSRHLRLLPEGSIKGKIDRKENIEKDSQQKLANLKKFQVRTAECQGERRGEPRTT